MVVVVCALRLYGPATCQSLAEKVRRGLLTTTVSCHHILHESLLLQHLDHHAEHLVHLHSLSGVVFPFLLSLLINKVLLLLLLDG